MEAKLTFYPITKKYYFVIKATTPISCVQNTFIFWR